MSTNSLRTDRRQFYKIALALALPMIGQNLVSSFVSMIDNIMIGQVGTNQMNAVSIVNQFIFVYNITVFGGLAGPGIFGTQFFGKHDHNGHRYTFCFRLLIAVLLSAAAFVIFSLFSRQLITLFLSENSDPLMRRDTLLHGQAYLKIILWSLIPFAVGQTYSSALREVGQSKVPFFGSLAAIGVNVVLNYCLIFGKFGFPEMGVEGAAVATVIAKFIESGFMILYAHRHISENRYLENLSQGFRIPSDLALAMTKKGIPLLINEFLWALGMSFIAQCYAYRGLEVVAARNIASTLSNLFSSIYIQFGGAAGILLGRDLGAGDFDSAKRDFRSLTKLTFWVSVAIVLAIIPIAFFFPNVYNTTTEIKQLATFYIICTALAIPALSFTNICYFALRSGGKTFLTFLYDFIFTWFIQIPLCFILCRRSSLPIEQVMILVTHAELIKTLIGYFMVRSGIWMVNLVNSVNTENN